MESIACPSCSGENQAGSRFCIHCGTVLSLEEAPEGGIPQTSGVQEEGEETETSVESLRLEVAQLRQEVRSFRELLQSLARPRGDPGQPASREGLQPMGIAMGSYQETYPVFSRATTSSKVQEPVAAPTTSQASAEPPPTWGDLFSGWDWEQIPGNWFARVGGLALVIGVGFFLSLAFDNGWIGPTGQVVLGIVGGLLLLGAGEYWQGRYPIWAQAVTGSGIAILYLSLYAAFGIYELLATAPSFGFLVVITLTGSLLALRYQALSLAILAILGGLFTPIILERDLPGARLLLPYILILDLGVLGLATFRNWRWLTLLGATGSYILFGIWVYDSSEVQLAMEQTGLALIFLVFVGATSLFHLVWRRTPEYPDLLLMTANAATYLGITAALLAADYDGWLPLVALSLAFLYGMVAYSAVQRCGASVQLVLFALATALVFLTITIPLQLTGNWITIAWAAEGAILVRVGLLLRNYYIRAFGLVVFPIVIVRLLFFDTPVGREPFTPILNERFLTFIVAIAAMYLSAFLYLRYRQMQEEWEEYALPAFLGLANFFSLWIISAEVIHYFDSRSFSFDAANARNLTLTLLWALYAGIILAVGTVTGYRQVRLAALGLLSVVVLKLFLVDTFLLGSGYRVVAYMVLGFALLIIGFFYQRYSRAMRGFFLG